MEMRVRSAPAWREHALDCPRTFHRAGALALFGHSNSVYPCIGDVGLLALNAECGQWVEPGFGLPEGLVDEMIGERFKSGCSVRSDEDDKDDGDKAQGPTATGARETLLASVEAGGTRALAEGGTSSNTGAAECATRGKDAHDGTLQADELKLIQRLEEEAAVMLGVGLKTDWTLLRAALRMIQPNMSAGIKALTHSDIFVDLGCGDGRICIEAALRFNCSAVGVDIDWRCVDEGLNVVGALDLQDKVTLTHGDLLDYNFSAASLVYAFVPAELLAPTSPLYAKLHAFLSGGGMVITCYSVLDYLSPAGVVILDKSRQAFLYTHRSCAKTYVPDPLEEYKAAHAATVVSFGMPEGTKEGGDEAWND